MAVQSGHSPFAVFSRIGNSPTDSEALRLQKSLLVVVSLAYITAGILWGMLYFLFQEPIAGLFPLAFSILASVSLVHFWITHRYPVFRTIQLVLILFTPFILMVTLGGFANSSMVILWSLISPLGAMMFAEYKQAPRWFAIYLLLIVLSGFLEPQARPANNLPEGVMTAFYVLNLGAASTIAFVLLYYFVSQKERAYRLLEIEQNRSESLLLNILPCEIAERLKAEEKTIADHCPAVSILFADLAGFTPLTNELSPTEMVELLNRIYSEFDELIEKHGAEKIRTIGDSYMIASGLPNPRSDHAQVLALLALEMKDYVASLPPVGRHRLSYRMGINSGPVIAGVIGHKKFAYDVWGDTVNTASRMESQGVPGKIQIPLATYELVQDDFRCEVNGPITVKGKGEMKTWFLAGVK